MGTRVLYFERTDRKLKAAKNSWGWGNGDANLIFKIDSSVWDKER